MPVYLFYGDESYLLNRELKRLRQQVVNPAMAALTHRTMKSPSIPQLLEAVGTVSFSLGGDSLLEVQGFSPLEKAAADGDKPMLEDLKGLLQTVEPSRHIVFINTKVDRKVGFAKWMTGDKSVQVREFKKLEPWKVDAAVQLVVQDAKQQGIAIQPQAATVLVENLGTDLQLLMNEVEKLGVYAADRPISPQDVALLCNHNENTFQMLSDWVAGRNRAEVFTVLDELLLRQHPVQLFALAQTYLNNAYRLRLWKQVGLSEGEMVERTKKHPYKLKMDLQEFGAIPLARLAMLKARITELEWQFKSGQLPDRLAFETLMSL